MKRRLCFLVLSSTLPVVLFGLFLSILLPAPPARAGDRAPQQPSISLAMTVGLDPGVCATSDMLTLPLGGGNVTYCYEVTNTGDVVLTRHTLDDARLGHILAGFPYTLTPGASVFVTLTALITMTTESMATWTAYNPGPVDLVSDSDGATVNVPEPDPSIDLVMTVGTDPAVCATTQAITLPLGGGEVTYCYAVTNTGNVILTRHTLDDARLGSILLDFPFTLAPGASVFVTQTAPITMTTESMATWTAYNPGPVDLVSDSDGTTVNVPEPDPSIALAMTVGTDPAVCATTQIITLPRDGGDVTYCYEVTNTGNVILTRHTLDDARLGNLLLDFPYTLLPGASVFVTATESIAATTVNAATWTAYNPGPVDEVLDAASVDVVVETILYLPLIHNE